MDTTDLRLLVEVLCSFNHTRAIRINCSVSPKTYGRPVFESYLLHDKYPLKMRAYGHMSQVARRLNTPLLAMVQELEEGIKDFDVVMNTDFAACLHLSCDLVDRDDLNTWGKPAEYWQSHKGDIIVLRADRKPLYPKYVEALCAWCRDDLQPLMLKVKEFGGSDSFKKEVVAQITHERFEAFMEKYKKEGRIAKY